MDPGSHVGFQISTKSGRGPSSEHFWQVWLISVQRFQRRRFKCEKLTDGQTLTHDKSSHGLWPGELKTGVSAGMEMTRKYRILTFFLKVHAHYRHELVFFWRFSRPSALCTNAYYVTLMMVMPFSFLQ